MEQGAALFENIPARLESVSQFLTGEKERFKQQAGLSHGLQPNDVLETFYTSRAQLRHWERIEAEYESVNALAPVYAVDENAGISTSATGLRHGDVYERALREMDVTLASLEQGLESTKQLELNKASLREHYHLFWEGSTHRESQMCQIEAIIQSLRDLQARDDATEPLYQVSVRDTSGEKLLKRLKILRRHANNLFGLLAGTWTCACQSQHVTDLRLRTVCTDEEFRQELVFQFGPSYNPNSAWDREATTVTGVRALISSDNVTNNQTSDPNRSRAGKHVSFQDPIAPKDWTSGPPNVTGPWKTSENSDIRNLCSVLSRCNLEGRELGSLSAEGFRYVISHDPSRPWQGHRITTLHDILVCRDPSKCLNLPQRYQIAVALAEAHLRLHPTQWLGRRWSHHDIVFIAKDEIVQANRPFLRTTMRRKSSPSRYSRDEATQTLGILLLELRFGKTLSEYRNDKSTTPATADIYEDVKDALKWVESIDGSVDPEFQETFQGVIDFCLRPQHIQAIDDSWREDMLFKVLQPLDMMLRSMTSIREGNFDSIAQRLRGIFEKAMVTCQTGRRERFDFEAEFCPDPAIWQIVEQHQTLVRALYIRSTKAQRATDGSLPEGVDDNIEDQAEEFLFGLRRAKHLQRMLGALLLSRSTPTSYAWLVAWEKFALACREIEPHGSALGRWNLPLDDEKVKGFFGALNRPEIAAFRTVQYCFCAVSLQQLRQRNEFNSPHLSKSRLPLKRREKLATKGSQGSVFRVIVHSGHLSGEDRELAMKDITVDNTHIRDEWIQTSWLMAQIKSHKCIMAAQASLRIRKRVLLFYDLAICDLLHFMTVHNTDGPANATERKALFVLIAEVGDAIRYLHCELKESFPHRMVCFHKDLKAENILVDRRRDGTDSLIFKITDFGIASTEYEIDESEECELEYPQIRTQKSLGERRVRTILGDGLSHSAPEARNGGTVSASADVWAYGTVLSEYLAWLFGGKESFDEFWGARVSMHGNPMSYRLLGTKVKDPSGITVLASDSRAVLKEEIAKWFTSKIARQQEMDGLMLLDDCWWLLREKLLVCDVAKRAKIDEVCAHLTSIAKGSLKREGETHRKRKMSSELLRF